MNEITLTEYTRIHLPGCTLICFPPLQGNDIAQISVIPKHRWQLHANECAFTITIEAKEYHDL